MAKKPKKNEPVVAVAAIDDSGVLLSVELVPESQAAPDERRLVFPNGCDLEPGRYRWDFDGQRFEPIVGSQPSEAPTDEPDFLPAIWDFIRAVQGHGVELPESTRRWLDWYGNSIDGRVRK